MKLGIDFYCRDDVVRVSRELLGKVLCTQIGGEPVSAVIIETEAYAGTTDKASHAYGGRRTRRTEPMYSRGGVAYVYLCYGIHHLFNVVSGKEGTPHAVLVRAAKPLEGIATLMRRRHRTVTETRLMPGPGTVSQALGIHTGMTGTDLTAERIWIEDRGIRVRAKDIVAAPRIGVGYAAEDALRPYRFSVLL